MRNPRTVTSAVTLLVLCGFFVAGCPKTQDPQNPGTVVDPMRELWRADATRTTTRGSDPVLEKIKARIPVGRLGEAEEIARGVLFLVSDDGGFITGSTLSINGGQHMY